jgi:uncharacterized protein (TIGR03437 family)
MPINKITALLIFCAGVAIPASAQNFDTSGNNKLNGDYFVRQVVTTELDQTTSAIGRAISLTGVMTFDGSGNYTFNGQITDSTVAGPAAPYSTSGFYSVESNGMAQILNPIDTYVTGVAGVDIDYGAVTGVGPVSIVASSTEGQYDDVFVAIQAGSGASNSSVSGSYNVGFIDFLQATANQVRDGYYTLVSSGNGSVGSVSVNGAMANQGSSNVTQVFSGVAYSITSPNGAGTLTFPTASTPSSALISGQKTFYVSADSTLLLGGDPNGFDLIVGIQALSGAASNSMYQGTYYGAAIENDASDEADGNDDIDSFYGSTLALGSQGATISHERLVYFDQTAIDDTFAGYFKFASDGSYNDTVYQYQVGANGNAVLIVGTGTTYSMSVNLLAQSTTPTTSVFLDPLSIFNAASYAPITNSVAPGEYVTIFGTGFTTGNASATTLPFSKHLNGVQVTVNGQLAPLQFVSPTQINLLVPSVTTQSYATFQVFNNGVPSNKVTVYNNLTAPGIFTFTSLDGTYPPALGPAAVLHQDYSLVTQDNPAVGGETLQIYVTGLGSVTPPVADGAAAPLNGPISYVDEFNAGTIMMDIMDPNGQDLGADVTFAGLAPGLAGLYQINFVVPTGLASGLSSVNLQTYEAYTSEALLFTQ